MAHLRVLVADDNPVNRKVAEFTLRKLGHRATVVSNGRQAVAAWETGEYDLILMDCQMPIMDGFEATVEIRRREPAGQRISIVAMTASDIENDRERCRVAGMDGYSRKPAGPDELSAILANAMTGRPVLASVDKVGDATSETIHPGTVAALRQLAEPDEPDPFPEIAGRFLRNASSRVGHLRASLDRAGLCTEAHSLRGMSGTIGAVRLARLCGDLEDAASQDAALTASIIQSVHDEFVRVQRALAVEMQRSPVPTAG